MADTGDSPGWAKDEENAPLATADDTTEAFAEAPTHTSTATSWGKEDEAKVFDPSAKRSCLHRFFRFVKFITIVSALMLFVAQIVSVVDGATVIAVTAVLKIYIMAFCTLVIFNELEWTNILRESKLLSNWIGRGFSYSFVGLVSVEENDVTARYTDVSFVNQTGMMFIEVVSYFMVAVGMIYFILGVSCCQLVANRERADYNERRNGGSSKVQDA